MTIKNSGKIHSSAIYDFYYYQNKLKDTTEGYERSSIHLPVYKEENLTWRLVATTLGFLSLQEFMRAVIRDKVEEEGFYEIYKGKEQQLKDELLLEEVKLKAGATTREKQAIVIPNFGLPE